VDELGGKDAVDLFADSGAFSAANAGADVSLDDYATWLRRNHTALNFAAALDVIGDPKASEANASRLRERVGDDVVVVPTFHVGSPWRYLDSMLADYDFIALGGAVAFNRRTDALMGWLVQAHQRIKDAGAVAHGFGLTRPPYPELLPWYSVDSAYWGSVHRTGTLSLWDAPKRAFTAVRLGRKGAGKHALLLRKYGVNQRAAVEFGFGRSSVRGADAKRDRAQLNGAAIASLRAYESHLRTLRDVLAPPGVRGDGPKVYLAAGSASDVRLIMSASRQAQATTTKAAA
jgi:hypothetical protein